jgi:hypothetical protein
MEDAMQPQAQHPELQGWQQLVGTWAIEATHSELPGTVVTGQVAVERGRLEDSRAALLAELRSFVPVVALGLVAVGVIAARKGVRGGIAMIRSLR